MTDTSQLKYAMSEDCQSYVMADEVFYTAMLAFAVPLDAPYLKKMSVT